MKDTHDLRVSARTAQLLASNGDDEGPPWRFSGVAVAAGDILHMDDGTPVLFTEENLRAAAETQRDEPLTVDHPRDENGRPQYPPPTDQTIGKVPKAGFVDAVGGVAYEATTHDENVANGVQAGSYEVSVHPTFALGDQDSDTGAYIAENIRFRDLSVVSKGDSPSNTVEWGPNHALASFTRSGELSSELAAASDVDEDDGGIRGLVERMAQRMGLIDSRDYRGSVWMKDQTTDGERVIVGDAGFEDAAWMVSIHRPGSEFDIGEGLGPTIGTGEPHEAGEYEPDETVILDEPLEEDQTLFSVLRYHADGEVSDPITSSDGGYFVDSAFVGVAPDGVDTAEATASASDESAESDTGADDNGSTDMNDDPDDDGAQNGDPDGGDTGSKTLGEMTVDELGEALREQGFVTEDSVADLAQKATAQASKAEQVDEIIAKSDDFDEEDRESLMASADKMVDREHKRVRGELAADLPGGAGTMPTLTAGSSGDNDVVDEYGTGVAED